MANDKGRTPLMEAAIYGELETAELLVAAGASADLVNKEGVTAFMHAIIAQNPFDIIQLLLGCHDLSLSAPLMIDQMTTGEIPVPSNDKKLEFFKSLRELSTHHPELMVLRKALVAALREKRRCSTVGCCTRVFVKCTVCGKGYCSSRHAREDWFGATKLDRTRHKFECVKASDDLIKKRIFSFYAHALNEIKFPVRN